MKKDYSKIKPIEKHQQGVCPFCGSEELEYGDSGLQDISYYYKWECKHCGHRGTEWYDLEFAEHTENS